MRTDELSRALHAQAEEAMATSPVGMAGLRARRSRQRRRAALGTGLASVLVAGGVSLAVPALDVRNAGSTPAAGPTVPASSTPVPRSTGSPRPAAGWTALDCNRREVGGCAVPSLLGYGGRTYVDRVGGVQPVFAPNGLNREIRLSSDAGLGLRLLLVGATGAGPGSRLELRVGSGAPRQLPGGRLTVWLVPASSAGTDVVVRETGTPTKGEVLRIEGYAAQPDASPDARPDARPNAP